MSMPQKIRVVVCLGEYCNLGRRGDTIFKAVQPLVAEANQSNDTPPVKLETARCLSMCAVGPNMVIYPDDLVFNKLTPAQAVEAINRCLATVRDTAASDAVVNDAVVNDAVVSDDALNDHQPDTP